MKIAGFSGVKGYMDCNILEFSHFHKKSLIMSTERDFTSNIFNLEILNTYSRYPTSTSDAFICRGSQVRQLLEQKSTIERCNARLKLIFRCLLGERKVRYAPNKVGTLVNTCAGLLSLGILAAL
nr:unnamed protein product [Callosobruchus analis]